MNIERRTLLGGICAAPFAPLQPVKPALRRVRFEVVEVDEAGVEIGRSAATHVCRITPIEGLGAYELLLVAETTPA